MIIGSTAIKHYFPDFPREPKDIDYIGVKGKSNKEVEYLENDVLLNYTGEMEYLSPDFLYSLKISHIFWDLDWDKHMFDVQWLRKKGCKLDKDLFHKLYAYWNEFHGKNKRSDLKMSSLDFFNNAISCKYEHDDLHKLLNPIPTYTKILIGEVEVSEEKFNNLSYEDKCNLVYEEVELMSWERWPTLKYWQAYIKMFKKFLISHAPIWEAIFIVENYLTLSKPRQNHFKKINDGLKEIEQHSKGFILS